MNRYLLAFVILFLSHILQAQKLDKIEIDASANGTKLTQLLKQIEQTYPVDFIFNKNTIETFVVAGVEKSYSVLEFLEVFLGHLTPVKINEKLVLIVEKEVQFTYGNQKSNYLVLEGSSSDEVWMRGYIKDASTDEALINAQVYLPETDRGTLTDVNGYFELGVQSKIQKVEIRYTGYENVSYLLAFSPIADNSTIEVSLFPSSTELENITITAERRDVNVTSKLTGVERMGIQTIKSLPPFMGEVDPVKSLTTLPGVSTTGEIASGFNVRGGESGQNLILQDGSIIFNPTHLFGFFSAFNPDIVNDVVLYKGGGPASFGGRASSVLDINLKNGDLFKHSVNGGIGLISSRLTVEGPIVPKKSSFIIGGRLSYSDWIINAVDNVQLKNSSADFYDITGKFYHKISDKDVLTLSGYHSYDDFSFDNDSLFSWSTTNFSFQWEHSFTENTINVFSVNNSNYQSSVINQRQLDAFEYTNGISNLSVKDILTWQKNDHQYFAGISMEGSLLEPGRRQPTVEPNNTVALDLNNQKSVEGSLFIGTDLELSEAWAVSAGLRYSTFFRLGSDQLLSVNKNEMDGRYYRISDTVNYENGEFIQYYGGIEPRLSVRYLLNPQISLKASYNRTYQYLHLISNTISPTPNDFWIASSPVIEPQIADQVSLGYFHNFNNDRYEISVEGFYKTVDNTLDYLEGVEIALNERLESGLAQGSGVAYGLEFLARKREGKINGWLSYTYSRSLRQFESSLENFEINEGEFYPSFFDQPHNLSLILNYQFTPSTNLTTNFSYSSGRPITIPISKYSFDTYLSLLNYSDRNVYRMPDYHRLDISLTVKGKQFQNQKYSDEWVFAIYNLYGRRNPYTIYFDEYGNAFKLSVLGNVFPSITYNFKFQ